MLAQVCCVSDTTSGYPYSDYWPDGSVNAWDYGALKSEWGNDCVACRAPVPKTGQTTCYEYVEPDWVEVDCEDTGQDGDLRKGVEWPNPRFTDNGNGTLTDNLTGLTWLQDANCIASNYPDYDQDSNPGDGAVNWQHALDFVAGINDGTYSQCGAAATDWRLPNIRELSSLIDFTNYYPALPISLQLIIMNNMNQYYWSSTTHANTLQTAWAIHTGTANLMDAYKDAVSFVWPVRSDN